MSSNQIVKEGYKQTEVGVIPEDWNVVKLSDIGFSLIGLTYSPNDVRKSGTLVLRSSNIQNNRLAFDNNVFVEMLLPSRVIVKKNDLLICVRNGSKKLIGKCTLITDEANGMAFGAFMSLYRSHINQYVLHQFQSNVIQNQINEVLGATINQITNKDLASFSIAVPPKRKEITIIAKALSDTDTLITSLNALIHKKEQIKQGTMQQLLTGKIRLQGFGKGKGVKKTELGEISEDWEVVNISYLATIIMGQSPAGSSYNSSGKGVALINGPTEFTELYPVKKQWTTQPTKYCKKDDLLLCVRGSSTGRINISNDTYCIGRGVAAIRATNQSNTSYILYQLIQLIEKLLSKSTGSTFPSIDGKTIKSLLVTAPTKAEQTAIANVLTTIDTDIQTLKQRLEKTKSLKQGMMQELLTGKIRLIPPISGKIEAV